MLRARHQDDMALFVLSSVLADALDGLNACLSRKSTAGLVDSISEGMDVVVC